ncbi:MAG: hypothetical protein L3J42_03390 [Hydrogenimonas sp.]|nr:hypothetical protein [Hydrogenimonas sp.]
MKNCSVALLGEVLYFVDKEGRLNSFKDGALTIECSEPMDVVDICAGVGGCGNYRIFIADAKDMTIKVFDPLNRRLATLLKLQKRPESLAKEECTLAIGLKSEILLFDLKELRVKERVSL